MWISSWIFLSVVPLLVLADDALHIVARQDGTSTTAIGLPAPTPQLSFDKIELSTTCQSGLITWIYSGPDGSSAVMDLIITNVDVPQDGDPSSGPSLSRTFTNDGPDPNRRRWSFRRATPNHLETDIIHTIRQSVNPNTSLFIWDKIDVPQGNYMFLANFTGFTRDPFKSRDFFINNGSDVSCLISTPPTSSSPGGTLPTSSGNGPTDSASSSPPSSSSSSPSQVPVGASGKINKPALAGSIVGALALLAFLSAAFLFFRCSPRRDRKWGAVGSYDSAAPRNRTRSPYGSKSKTAGLSMALGLAGADQQKGAGAKHKSQSESMGPIMVLESSVAHPTTSDEYVNEEEKYTGSRSEISHGHEIDMAVPVLGVAAPSIEAIAQKNPIRNSSQSVQSYSYAYPSPVPSQQYQRPRAHSNKQGSPSPQTFPESVSASTSTLDSFQGALDPRRASSPPGVSPAYPSGGSGVLPAGNSDLGVDIPASSFAASSPITPTPTRKTPRKPVPKYSPTSEAAEVAGSTNGLGLVHKNGSGDLPGGKQMHYLIPDPVPPPRD